MDKITPQQVRTKLERAGLKLPQTRIDQLAESLEQFRPRLESLHSVDVEQEEMASIFSAGWSSEEVSHVDR